jgi:DNA repair protein RecO (recombination protein O)
MDHVETTDAILLRRTKLSDTSLIITWSTERHGRIKTVARGARRPKSPLAGKLDLFFEAEISFVHSSKSELHTLKEVVLKNPREGLRKDIQRVELGAYFVELYELVTESDHASPELYDLLRRAFDHLNEQPASKRAMLHFESELTRLLGIQNAKEATPVLAIGHQYGRLPQGRAKLLKDLGSKSASVL